VNQRLGELDALLHAGRVGLEIPVARLAETDVIRGPRSRAHGVGGGEARELAAVGNKRHGVHAGNAARRFPALYRAAPESSAGPWRPSKSSTCMRPDVGATKAEQRLEHRALARRPFGPSRPTAPGGKQGPVTSLSARVSRRRRRSLAQLDDGLAVLGMHSLIRRHGAL